MIAMDKIENPDEWETCYSFYAFDIPVPGTVTYNVQHCLRSIYSANEVVPRHRMTRADPRLPWEFRQVIYVFPADLYDCTFSQTPPTHF